MLKPGVIYLVIIGVIILIAIIVIIVKGCRALADFYNPEEKED